MTTAAWRSNEADIETATALRIIESMPGFAWAANAMGRIIFVSPKASTFYGDALDGLKPEEDDKVGWRRLVHPDDYDRVAASWRDCLKTGDPFETEHGLRHGNRP